MNYLYCFDENYNIQAYNSISSLLSKLEKPSGVNIYIIHKNPKSFEKYLKKLSNWNSSITIYEFQKSNFDFPNLESKHISEATYYRLFIDKYLPSEIEFIIYLDADIYCLNDPTKKYYETKSALLSSNYDIAACSELYESNYHSDRLKLKSKKYFNAGLICIDYQKWQKKYSSSKLLENMEKIRKDVLWWDQDVLNSSIDGNYYELNNAMNYLYNQVRNYDKESKYILSEVYFLHYLGKSKPWSIFGILEEYSEIYQNIHRQHNSSFYHIDLNPRTDFVLINLKTLLSIKNLQKVQRRFAFLSRGLVSIAKLIKSKNKKQTN